MGLIEITVLAFWSFSIIMTPFIILLLKEISVLNKRLDRLEMSSIYKSLEKIYGDISKWKK